MCLRGIYHALMLWWMSNWLFSICILLHLWNVVLKTVSIRAHAVNSWISVSMSWLSCYISKVLLNLFFSKPLKCQTACFNWLMFRRNTFFLAPSLLSSRSFSVAILFHHHDHCHYLNRLFFSYIILAYMYMVKLYNYPNQWCMVTSPRSARKAGETRTTRETG